MASRPVFVISKESDRLITTKNVEFEWFPGFAVIQKQKSIQSLHSSAKQVGIYPILEISSKSMSEIGKSLSAFNLLIRLMDETSIPIESAYQGSKVFELGGPYVDLYSSDPIRAKKDIRLKNSGRLKSFLFEGINWELYPPSLFYDWLYIKALSQNSDIAEKLTTYMGFTDIEFNPKKSYSCQAQSAAIYVFFKNKGLLEDVLNDEDTFIEKYKLYYEISLEDQTLKL